MFKRVARIFKVNSNELLKKLERPIPILEQACQELKEKAVTTKKKALELDAKLDKQPTMPNLAELRKITVKLHDQAQMYKTRHDEYVGKIEMLKAKKDVLETSLDIIRASQGLGDAGDALSIIKNTEDYLESLENEIRAYTELGY